MECEKEVLRIQKKLEKIVKDESSVKNQLHTFIMLLYFYFNNLYFIKSQDQALDYLKALKNLPVDLNVLTSTRIGMTVNAIRKKSSDDEVNSLTKVLIKKWKKLLPGMI